MLYLPTISAMRFILVKKYNVYKLYNVFTHFLIVSHPSGFQTDCSVERDLTFLLTKVSCHFLDADRILKKVHL